MCSPFSLVEKLTFSKSVQELKGAQLSFLLFSGGGRG